MTYHRPSSQAGFTLLELLVAMSLLSVTAIGFYTLMFSGARSADVTQNLATISQEARLGLNRMIRDTREASELTAATATSYTIKVDFNGDGDFTDAADFEQATFAYVGGLITISNGTTTETLAAGVSQIGTTPIFDYSSNRLEYDSNNDGKTTVAELDAAQGSGSTLTIDKLPYISSISYAFRITSGARSSDFYTQAQLRNRR